MTDTIYPEIVNFVRGEEVKIENQLKAILDPYRSIVEQGLVDLRHDLHAFIGDGSSENHLFSFDLPNFDSVKATAGLHLPPLIPFLEYSNRIKAEAFINAGYFSILKVFRKIFNRQSPLSISSYTKTLQRSVRQMKKQTEESILFQCKNYRENLKFAYLHRLVEEVTQRLADNLTDRFSIYDNGTTEMKNHVSQLRTDKDCAIETVREMTEMAATVGKKLKRLRLQIEQS